MNIHICSRLCALLSYLDCFTLLLIRKKKKNLNRSIKLIKNHISYFSIREISYNWVTGDVGTSAGASDAEKHCVIVKRKVRIR